MQPLSQDARIRSAVFQDAQALTHLIYRAKAFWGYPREWMEAWREELTISTDYIAQHRVVVAELQQRPAAFYGLELRLDVAHLEHLWVEPAYIGSGLGRRLFALACEAAKASGYTILELVADPFAEGFYRRQGATRCGEVHGSILGNPRVLPKMRLVL